jgi:hypothetical protein
MPDEFILGYLGRVGAVNGIKSESDTRTALRGWYEHQNGSISDGTLVEHLAYASGVDTHHFACHHTLIPAYRAVASHLHEHKHGDSNHFGLLSANAPRLMRVDLQLCAECINEDINYLGFTFWRRSHQLPGIDWCLKHATTLHNIEGKTGFFTQPSIAIEASTSCGDNQDVTESNQVIRRYVELLQIVLDFPKPISPSAITPLLTEKARQVNLRTNPIGKRPVLSDLAIESLPRRWAMKHFPKLIDKPLNQFLYEYDGVCKPGGKAHASTSYILATAILCKTVDGGQQLWWQAFNTPPTKSDKSPAATNPIPIRCIKSAYTSSSGNIKRMADLIGCNYNSLNATMKNLGLSSLTYVSIHTLKAVLDFCEKKATLQEILCRPNVQTDYIAEILRTAASPHSKLISNVVSKTIRASY